MSGIAGHAISVPVASSVTAAMPLEVERSLDERSPEGERLLADGRLLKAGPTATVERSALRRAGDGRRLRGDARAEGREARRSAARWRRPVANHRACGRAQSRV